MLYWVCNIWIFNLENRNQIKKIVFTGPECSGKTTLSNTIANKLSVPLVTEYARDYLNNLDREYCYSDLVQIAKGQIKSEKEHIHNNSQSKILVCDTNLQVIKIWSQIKYSKCDPFIINNQDENAFYVLCCPDFLWQYDPLREHKNKRMMLFKKYQQDLEKEKYNFIIAAGPHKKRISFVIDEIKKMVS